MNEGPRFEMTVWLINPFKRTIKIIYNHTSTVYHSVMCGVVNL